MGQTLLPGLFRASKLCPPVPCAWKASWHFISLPCFEVGVPVLVNHILFWLAWSTRDINMADPEAKPLKNVTSLQNVTSIQLEGTRDSACGWPSMWDSFSGRLQVQLWLCCRCLNLVRRFITISNVSRPSFQFFFMMSVAGCIGGLRCGQLDKPRTDSGRGEDARVQFSFAILVPAAPSTWLV